MAELIPFAKYEGLGNDFVLIDDPLDRLAVSAELAAAVCDRRLGIGADGLLVVAAPRQAQAAARMRYWNQDGSPSAMCGNGIRCVAKHVRDRHGVPLGPFVIDTDAGPVRCRIAAEGEGLSRVEVELVAPRLDPATVPVVLPGGSTEIVRESNGRGVRFTALSMGNPHAVTFDVADESERRWLGPAMESDVAFPERVNVGFAQLVGPAELRLDVYERGCGFTRACGSGAAAAVVAAGVTGRIPWGTSTVVHLPGGDLRLTAPGPDRPVLMEGPARRVFEGTFVVRHLVPGSRP
ncbi:MAG: diaminopimelate epimerase [Deltaproteobacteria bacterium]|nr:diaminopimelate epimerase [Deltaproteobacteria bacterium]